MRNRLPPDVARGRHPLRVRVVPLPPEAAAWGAAPSPARPVPASASLNWSAPAGARRAPRWSVKLESEVWNYMSIGIITNFAVVFGLQVG